MFSCLGVLALAVFANMTYTAQLDFRLERNLIQKVAEPDFHVLSLGAFLRCVRYSPLDRLT